MNSTTRPFTLEDLRSGRVTAEVPGDFLSALLSDQQQLSAVDEFSITQPAPQEPAQENYYSKLMPASPPQAGQQYAFKVDLDSC